LQRFGHGQEPAQGRIRGGIHDAFFKRIMNVPEKAGLFLREHLPGEVAVLISGKPPVILPASFVDPKLDSSHADLLVETEMLGCEVLLHLHFEHKSAPDPLTHAQVLGYMSDMWKWRRHNRGALRGSDGMMPLILAVVVHHGPRMWPYPVRFGELLGRIPQEPARYVPDFEVHLIDLAAIPDDKLSSDPVLRAELLTMKRILSAGSQRQVEALLMEVLILDDVALRTVLNYIGSVIGRQRLGAAMNGVAARGGGERMEEIRDVLREIVEDEVTAKITARVSNEVRPKVSNEVRAKVSKEIRAKVSKDPREATLTRPLRRRFGVLPKDIEQRIARASAGQLDSWLDRETDAPDLRGVFASRRRG
jgi:hypothetical protein